MHRTKVRQLLRARTSAAHHELEALLVESSSFSSRAGYIKFLRAQHRIHAAVEPSLERHPELERALPDLRTRLKAAAIASDLRFLGWEPGPVAATRALDDEAHAWGALYVLEGSTLGTTTIGRLVREHLGADSDGGLRFLRWHEDRRAQRWATFLGALEERGRSLPLEDIAGGATWAFARVRHELVRTGSIDPSRRRDPDESEVSSGSGGLAARRAPAGGVVPGQPTGQGG